MEFGYSAEEYRFRAEARNWIRANLPPGWGRTVHESDDEHERYMFRLECEKQLFGGGWAGLAWPREYGGRGRSTKPSPNPSCASGTSMAGSPSSVSPVHRAQSSPSPCSSERSFAGLQLSSRNGTGAAGRHADRDGRDRAVRHRAPEGGAAAGGGRGTLDPRPRD